MIKQFLPHPTSRNLISLLFCLLGSLFFQCTNDSKSTNVGPTFTKEATLTISEKQSSTPVVTVDIEIADDDLSREKGLMWRKSMEELQGMLFIMEAEIEQTFWMLNTYIALDLIFLDSNQTIVSIKPNNPTNSLSGITSDVPAKYVLEVNAGFVEKYNLKVGQQMSFERLNK